MARVKMARSGRRLLRGEGHLVAELAQLVQRPATCPDPPPLIQVGRRWLPVLPPVTRHVVGNCQDARPHPDDGALLATAGDRAALEPGQSAAPRLLGACRPVGRLGQSAPQPPTPLARRAAGALSGALAVAR